MARVVTIFEKSLGESHPNVAVALSNLAWLLQATTRLGEAEPLMARAVEITRSSELGTGYEHPHWQIVSANYRSLLQGMGKSDVEIEATFAELGATIRKSK